MSSPFSTPATTDNAVAGTEGAAANTVESGEGYYIDANQGIIVAGKKCSRCGYIKPLGAFHYKTKGRFGRQEWCKRCTRGKPPLSWADEYAEIRQQERQQWEQEQQEQERERQRVASSVTGSRDTGHQGVSHMTQHAMDAADGGAIGTGATMATPIDVIDEVDEVIEEGATGKRFALEEGQMEFSAWLKSDYPVFSSPLFTVKRSSLGDDGYTLYVNAEIAAPSFVPVGDILGTQTIELAVRVLAGNTSGEPRVYGFAQR